MPDLRAITLAALAWGLGGCATTPVYERPPAPVPEAYPVAAVNGPSAADRPWVNLVRDERLRQLIERALVHNRDLQAATLAVEQVRAQYRVQQAAAQPSLNLALGGSRQPDGQGGSGSSYSAGLIISAWEWDFFGRLASLEEAARAQYLASEEGRHAAQTSLVAAVAASWLSLQTQEALLALSRQTLANREASERLVRLRHGHGVASALDLRQAESLSAAARVVLAQQERQRARDRNALTLLAGQVLPEGLLTPVDDPQALFEPVPPGLPAELLVRRADIRQAEQQLVAANAQIGAARAAFFPRISLTAGFGSVSRELSGLLRGDSWGFTLAPQLLLPIVDAGRNQATLEAAEAGRALAVARYEKTIQTAFREVADALADGEASTRQIEALRAQTQAEEARLDLVRQRQRQGVAGALEVLDAERSLFASRQAWVQARWSWAQSQIGLYAALGGGWDRQGGR